MRIPFASMFMTSPFEGLKQHAEKIIECAWAFQEAFECYLVDECKTFEDFRKDVAKMESEADAVKRRIRGHIPKGTIMPIHNFLLFRYLREQDSILDAFEDALDWISYRFEPGIPKELHKDFMLLVDVVIDPIEQLSGMIDGARKYFKNYSEEQRVEVKNIIHTLRKKEREADDIEDGIKLKVFDRKSDAITVFHLVRLAEIISSIADHTQNSGDMMRAMISK